MNFKVYVGNLSYEVTSDQLNELFSQAGTVVDSVVISDRQSGRSKGFGFVELSSKEEMDKAVEMFNEKEFEGRSIRVSPARPQEDRKTFQ